MNFDFEAESKQLFLYFFPGKAIGRKQRPDSAMSQAFCIMGAEAGIPHWHRKPASLLNSTSWSSSGAYETILKLFWQRCLRS